jgi:predicted small metal-binding protein
MAKVLHCGDLMPGCKAVLEGKDEAEVMAKGAAHAKQAHNIATIPPEMAAKVNAARSRTSSLRLDRALIGPR